MNVIEYIKYQMADVCRSTDRVMNDLTDEMFNWVPPGTANTISATFVHYMYVEDHFVQMVLQSKPSVWESGKWADKTKISKVPDVGEDWSEFKHKKVNIKPLQEYKLAVVAATNAYLSKINEDDLDRKLDYAGKERTVAWMLIHSAAHSNVHIGEIAAVKGIQGAKGWFI